MRESILEVKGVSFSYGERKALEEVSLCVGPGEVVGVIGPNASGKSTLLRLVSRVIAPARGQVLLHGCPLGRFSREALARQMAVVSQNPTLPEGFTTSEVVLLGRTPHLRLLQAEGERDLKAAWQAMKLAGIDDLAGRRIGELSGGERQRVVIARALAQEPHLLLLDEPTAHLDLSFQAGILDLVTRLSQERGLGVLAAFHDLNLAAQYCRRLLLLCQGRVWAQGTPAEVITPENIAAVYGARVHILPHPVNRLPTTIITPGDGHLTLKEAPHDQAG